MSNNAAGARRHPDRRVELSQLSSPHSIHRSQRIAEQAARDAVAHWRAGNALALLLASTDPRRTTMLTPAPEATSGAG